MVGAKQFELYWNLDKSIAKDRKKLVHFKQEMT